MNPALQRLNLVEQELDHEFELFSARRRNVKRRSFYFGVGSIALSALVTALLGLRLASTSFKDLFANIALLLGVLITFLNAAEAHYNHRGLWIQRTIVLSRLNELK